jgi:hypothetical protein
MNSSMTFSIVSGPRSLTGGGRRLTDGGLGLLLRGSGILGAVLQRTQRFARLLARCAEVERRIIPLDRQPLPLAGEAIEQDPAFAALRVARGRTGDPQSKGVAEQGVEMGRYVLPAAP